MFLQVKDKRGRIIHAFKVCRLAESSGIPYWESIELLQALVMVSPAAAELLSEGPTIVQNVQ